MKLAFMGSPEFAVPCLKAVAETHEVVLVVSQPDKPAGRGSQLTAPPVAAIAKELGLPLIQPKSARNGELEAALKASGAELACVVAYGKILPKAVLEATPRGCINVHGSILPKYRGAAPVQWSVIDGDRETGVTIMQLDEGMDTGPVYFTERTPIGADETSGELMARLSVLGAAALVRAIDSIEYGARPSAQVGEPTHARMLAKEDGAIDFSQPAPAVAARIRGVDPWPGATAKRGDQVMKLFRAIAVDSLLDLTSLTPGRIEKIDEQGMHVECGRGIVVIREVQPPGKKRMSPQQLANGRGLAVGDVLA